MGMNSSVEIRKRRGLVDKREVAEHMLEEERNLIMFNLQPEDNLDSLNGEGVWGCLSDEDYALWKDDNYTGTVKALLLNWPFGWNVLFWGQEVTLRCHGDYRPTLDPEWVRTTILETEWYRKYRAGYALCVTDWHTKDGVLICKAGTDYRVEADGKYNDPDQVLVHGCEHGVTQVTTWDEIDEYLQHY